MGVIAYSASASAVRPGCHTGLNACSITCKFTRRFAMSKRILFYLSVCVLVIGVTVTSRADVPPLINYQGVLFNAYGTLLPNATKDMTFTIYDDEIAGNVKWTEIQAGVTTDDNGVFSVLLGSVIPIQEVVFEEPDRWLGIKVGTDPEITPRMRLVTVPYAFRVSTVDGATGGNVFGNLQLHSILTVGNTTGDVGLIEVTDGSATTIVADGLTQRVGIGTPSPTEKLHVFGGGLRLENSSFQLEDGSQGAGFVLTSDAAGVGTWLPAAAGADNDWTLGTFGNDVLFTMGEWGIAREGNILFGDHDSTHTNFGVANTTGSAGQHRKYATVSGGLENTASGGGATVGGGSGNTASDIYTTVGGGVNNVASWDYATVGGGKSNIASRGRATVGGGQFNIASQEFATVGGGLSNHATHNYTTIGGGFGNTASGIRTTIGGGNDNRASGKFATVGGGLENTASGDSATVGGGSYNLASGDNATVGGGQHDTASGLWSTVGGGYRNTASGDSATVGGGTRNLASGHAATVGGGANDTAIGDWATVGGGQRNSAKSSWSTVGGGQVNTASGTYTTIGGGRSNLANVTYATVGGGFNNSASGQYATVPGGSGNVATGSNSFAAGAGARANHIGSFVWADVAGGPFNSTAPNQFNVRASGGTRIFSNPSLSAGVRLFPNASGWAGVSDSALKRNIREVDYQEILEKLAELPISQWSYKAQDESIEHVGPMAQDFYRLFGLGEDDRYITTLDPDGIALAAIKALYERSKEVDQLRTEIEEMKVLIQEIIDQQTD